MLRNDLIDFNHAWQQLEDAFSLIAKKESIIYSLNSIFPPQTL